MEAHQQFVQWLRSKGCGGVDSVLFEKGPNPEQGVLVTCSRDIEAGSKVLTLPCHLLLDEESCRKHTHLWEFLVERGIATAASFGKRDATKQAWPVILLLAFLACQTEPCQHDAYLKILPKVPDCPTEAEFCHILGETHPLTQRAKQRSKDIETFFRKNQVEALGISLERLIWAHAMYWSRALQVPADSTGRKREGCTALVPFFDSMNHRPGAVSEIQVEEDKSCPTLALVSSCGLERGQELCINYGGKGNAELVFHFGFSIPYNPLDYILVLVGPKWFKFHSMQYTLPSGLLDAARAAVAPTHERCYCAEADNEPPIYKLPGSEELDWKNPSFYLQVDEDEDDFSIRQDDLGNLSPTKCLEHAALDLLARTLEKELTACAGAEQKFREKGIDERTKRVFEPLVHGETQCLTRLQKMISVLLQSLQ